MLVDKSPPTSRAIVDLGKVIAELSRVSEEKANLWRQSLKACVSNMLL